MESQGQRLGFTLLAFRPQWSNHHVRGRSEEWFYTSLYDLSLQRPKMYTLLHCDQLINVHLWRSPTGTFLWGLPPFRTGDHRAQPAGEQSRQPRSRPWHGEVIYLALANNVDQSTDSASPHDQRDSSPKIRLIGHHQEHRVLVITHETPYLNA